MVDFVDTGLSANSVSYSTALAQQRALHAAVVSGRAPDTVILLEHESVYTAGKRTEPHERPRDGTPVIEVDRGGKITWHGPGQLVGYPIMRVGDVPAFVATMEEAIVAALREAGVETRARSHEGREWTGVWAEDRKIASIGIHVSRGVSAHGFAVNVTNDLAPFTWVVACGLPSVAMTSLAQEGSPEGLACFRRRMAYSRPLSAST